MNVEPKVAGWTLAAVLMVSLFAAAGVSGLAQAGSRRPSLRWKFATDSWIIALAVGHDGTVYAGTERGAIYALSPDGTLRRKFSIPRWGWDYVWALAVGNDGTLYVQSLYGNLYAFEPDGAQRWKSPTSVRALAEGNDGLIYVAAGTDVFHADSVYTLAPDGALRRKFIAASPITALAVGKDGATYGGTSQFSPLYAFTPSGTIKWKVWPGMDVSALAVGNDGVVYDASRAKSLRIRDPVTGTMKPVPGPTQTIFAINPQTGSIMWSSKARGRINSVKVGGDGTVYMGSFDGNVYAFDPHSGASRWRFWTGNGGWGKNPVHALAVGNDGVIYAGSGEFVEAITPP